MTRDRLKKIASLVPIAPLTSLIFSMVHEEIMNERPMSFFDLV